MPDDTGSLEIYLTDISPSDKPWDVHRAIAMLIEDLYLIAGYDRYGERIRDCSLKLGFALKPDENGTVKLRLNTAHFCRVRHCPVCQWRRMLMWRARFFQALPKVTEAYPTHRWIFLTLTVANCPVAELRATLGQMNKAWHRMVKRKTWPAVGWVRSVEVTRSENDEAHPHFHALLMVPAGYFSGKGYMKQSDWTMLWQQSMKINYTPIVNVKAIKPRPKTNPQAGQDLDSMLPVAAILETLKYALKPEDMVGKGDSDEDQKRNAEWLAAITRELHKTRSISVGGVLKEFLSEEEPEDLVHAEGEELELTEGDIELWFGWRDMVKRYRKVEP